jgi:hypothetical protein
MITGSCQCGGIRFEIDKVTALTNCHCSVCRKTTGASFGTFAHVRADRFKLLSGEDLINPGYEWMPGHQRSFCSRCGSPAPKYLESTKLVSVPAGLLEGDPGVKPIMNVFVSSKMPWVQLDEDIPNHEKWAPGFVPKDFV